MDWRIVIGVILVVLVGGSAVAIWWWKLADRHAPYKDGPARLRTGKPGKAEPENVVVIPSDPKPSR